VSIRVLTPEILDLLESAICALSAPRQIALKIAVRNKSCGCIVFYLKALSGLRSKPPRAMCNLMCEISGVSGFVRTVPEFGHL
jgi:hypothetical protein